MAGEEEESINRTLQELQGILAEQVPQAPEARAGSSASPASPGSVAEGLEVLESLAKVLSGEAAAVSGDRLKTLQDGQRDLVSHVTHELRAPLMALKAALEILQGKIAVNLKADDSKMLNIALNNSDRLSSLITSILDFAKLGAGKMTVHPAPADPGAIAREAVDSLMPWVQKRNLKLSLSIDPDAPRVLADHARTTQVLINLISNAIKFTPAEGSIRVMVGADPEDAGLVRFVVADTGYGISKADQTKLFKSFEQTASGKMQIGGTGLGLAIAKALIDMQGGRLWFESEEKQGATFSFTLPVCDAAA